MKVIVNGRFLLHKTTGVERYAREILAELDKIVESGRIVVAIPSEVSDVPKYNNIQIIKVGRLHIMGAHFISTLREKSEGTVFESV